MMLCVAKGKSAFSLSNLPEEENHTQWLLPLGRKEGEVTRSLGKSTFDPKIGFKWELASYWEESRQARCSPQVSPICLDFQFSVHFCFSYGLGQYAVLNLEPLPVDRVTWYPDVYRKMSVVITEALQNAEGTQKSSKFRRASGTLDLSFW